MDRRWGALVAILVVGPGACHNPPPGQSYFDQNIAPILGTADAPGRCTGTTSGCHIANANDPYQFAAGNLDVSTFANIQKRRDVLAPFGAYPYPLLLIKGVAPPTEDPANPNKLQMLYGSNGATIDIDVLHAGGAVLQVNSADFLTLSTWLNNGATETGLPPPTPAQTGDGTCSTAVPDTFTAADATMYMGNANFPTFQNNVQPIFNSHGCVSNNCHGAPQSDFYITCGSDSTQLAYNFSQAWSFVANPASASQLLQVPLAVAAGGHGHQGGDQWSSTSDPDYVTILNWATKVGVLPFCSGCDDTDPRQFFADYVQPLLLSRGCSFEACHSPMATNDFKLRSGTQGFFSSVVLEKNFELLQDNFLALEFPDARRSRAIAKTILPDDPRIADPLYVGGIEATTPTATDLAGHRGGPVLETSDSGSASDPANCPAVWPFANGVAPPSTFPAFCTFQEWINRSRAPLLAANQVSDMSAGKTLPIVFVQRPAGQNNDHLMFDTFQGGADLMTATVTFSADNEEHIASVGAATSLTAGCPGFTAGQMDVGMPDVALDGDSVAFAARTSTTAWSIYEVSIKSGTCIQIVTSADVNGVHVHNFDPAWSPDGSALVFASTRGKPGVGPTLSRKRFLPQSDIWRLTLPNPPPLTAAPSNPQFQQMTALSNSEVRPHFMREGRMTMTTEKVSNTTTGTLAALNGGAFYQLSGRRMNWDLTDYHPLLSQRQTSIYANNAITPMSSDPSIDYNAAIDIREGNDGNFVMVLYDVDSTGASVIPGGGGALATFNRSVGPFEYNRSDLGFLPSVRLLGDPAATGHSGATSSYRAPFYMPDGEFMVSYAPTASATAWQLVIVNPRTGSQTSLLMPPGGQAYVDAVLAYQYPARTMYLNRRQLVFGGSVGMDTAHGVLYMPDAPMVFTLLTGNLRRGRPVAGFRPAKYLAVYSEGECPASGCTANNNGIYQSRSLLGKAQLASDGSVKVQLPAQSGVVLELQDTNGNPLVTMGEEHQLGPGEQISMGVQQTLFDAVCGGCHGSVEASELDIAVTADALTAASSSASQNVSATQIGN